MEKSSLATNPLSSAARPQVLGIHHLKFAVRNLDISIAWYERVLGAQHIPELDHTQENGSRFAAVCAMTDWSGLYLELRENALEAKKIYGWDPVTLAVNGKEDLEHWLAWLDMWRTPHSPLLTGPRGWLLILEVSVTDLGEHALADMCRIQMVGGCACIPEKDMAEGHQFPATIIG